MKTGSITLLLSLWLMNSILFAQQAPRQEIDLDAFIQKLVATQQDDNNYEDIYEALIQFYLNPLDVNSATADELRNLYVLSEMQIQDFLEHRQRYGAFLSLYELQGLDSFDMETIRNLLPFVTLKSRFQLRDFSGLAGRNTNHFLLLRTEQTLQKAKGYLDDRFLGSPQKFYARYRLQHPKDYSLGFIMEKDQGEPNFMDYVTAHFQLQNKGNLKNLIVGDYQLQFGQGLVTSGGYAAGKGGETIYTTRRSDLGARTHNSVLEGGFFRGAVATYNFNKLELTGFASLASRDASSNAQIENREDVFSSLLISGLHRTESEIARKGVLKETNVGSNLKWKLGAGHLGFTVLHTSFNHELERNSVPYAFFEFKGKQNTVIGSNFSYSWQNFNFFGEAARSSSGGIGATGGFVASLSPAFEWSLNLRNYDKDFHSFYANAFGEGSRTINERGVYTGIKFTPKRGVSFAAFYDKFSFPWLRYLVDGPSDGSDYLLRFTLKPTKKWLFYTQYHHEQKQKNMPSNETVSDYLVQTFRQNLLAHIEFSISRSFKSQTRVQYNSFKYDPLKRSNGYALIQDIEGDIGRLNLKSRVAFFKTDDYDSRIYAYENDVLYAVSFPAYYGKGIRYYLVLRYGISRQIDVWLRGAHSQLRGVESISSGVNQIPGNQKSDFKLQIRYKF